MHHSSSEQDEDDDTTANAALLAFHLSHRVTTFLFPMTVRHGDADSEIVDALHQDFPYLSDLDYLLDTSDGQKSEEKTDKERGKDTVHQGKKRHTTVQDAQTQTL